MNSVTNVLLDLIESDWDSFRALEEVRQPDSSTRTLVFVDNDNKHIVVDSRFECNVNILSDNQKGIAETVMLQLAMLEHRILKEKKWNAKVSYSIHGRKYKYVVIDIKIAFKIDMQPVSIR